MLRTPVQAFDRWCWPGIAVSSPRPDGHLRSYSKTGSAGAGAKGSLEHGQDRSGPGCRDDMCTSSAVDVVVEGYAAQGGANGLEALKLASRISIARFESPAR